MRLLITGLLLALLPPAAAALEYRSTSRPAILYDAPSTGAGKLAAAGRGLPLEVVVDTDAWVKVRDPGGRLAWIEKAALGGGRAVMVTGEPGIVRQQPRAEAAIAFHAVRGLLLEATGEVDAYGWLPVRHAGGLSGWIPAHEVWGR
ncbi:MAG TPA: SH3 domain-containing protein [Thiobacillaceae bacterium]|nr:SH3 domain-containing protein [Thiobacillaceae bacterium]